MQSSQIQYRSAIALDLISNLLKSDGRFNQHPVRPSKKDSPYNVLYHLQAASVLWTGGQFFQKKNVCDAAFSAFQLINECEFESQDSLIFVFQEKSLTIWNALVSILHFKHGNIDKGVRYLKSVLPCIEHNRVHPYIQALSLQHEKINQSTASDLGIVLLALLFAHELTGAYLEQSKIIGNQISRGHLEYSGYDAWGLTLLSKYADMPFYLGRRDMMVRAMNRMSASAMTSLFASITQQAMNASCKPDQELLQYQCGLQIDSKNQMGITGYEGAFVRKKRFPEVRIDYTIHNVLSFLQYLNDGSNIHFTI